jgi:hypothetical protein
MIAAAIDRNLAQRISYPYLWGVVVLTLIWPIVSLIIKFLAYAAGNIAMAVGDLRWSRFFGQQCCLEYKRHDYEKGIIKIKAESGTQDSSPAQI